MWTSQRCVGGRGLWLSFACWHLRASMQATLRPPPGLGCSSLSAEAAHTTQCLHPFFMIPGTQCLSWAMSSILMVPVDVSLQPHQHGAPGLGAQKFGPQAHQQGAIVNGPGQALEMSGILGVKEG